MLERHILPSNAAEVFDAIARIEAARALTLMGGTALALQISHRISFDLDFAVFTERLPAPVIERVIAELRGGGLPVDRITDTAKESEFRIHAGEPLGNFVRDYVCNQVKLQFFAHGRTPGQRAHYQAQARVAVDGMSFSLMGLDGLKTAKTLVLADRVRSRDLYDLMVLMREHGYTVADALGRATKLGTNNDPEHYKAVMRGLIPLDALDEGLNATKADTRPATIYAFFNAAISAYEQRRARDMLRQSPDEPGPR